VVVPEKKIFKEKLTPHVDADERGEREAMT
jgi:hypothetical protein